MTKEQEDIITMDGCDRYRSYLKYIFPTCKKCDEYMYIDDIDWSFTGCQNEFWFCPKCNFSMEVIVRYNKVYGIKYRENEENG